ncbi:MAG: hypothetical protein D6731_15075 [Planctomycetota bacterium]|nr:MAG: hypothetical protein D6731_15075 [Planctomycetota bacterium]
MGALNRIYRKYKDRVAFYLIYIREAHPRDGRRPDRAVRLDDPRSFAERVGVASTCREALGLELPVLVDGLEDTVARDYGAWPDRLYVVDRGGRVAYRGGPGPRGFDPVAWEAAIAKVLGEKAVGARARQRTQEELEAIRERLRKQRRASLPKPPPDPETPPK